MNIKEKAKIFATAAHAAVGQKRKYTDEPYIVHPIEVAHLVETHDGTDEMVAAGFLHDVCEDTGVTIELIHQEFGAEVAELVGWLTDISTPEMGNRATRKAIDRDHSANSPAAAQTVKLADLISNSRSILEYDRHFAKVYIREKKLLLEVLTKGDPRLRKMANDIVQNYINRVS